MPYLELFWIFFKIGLFTIGGGYAMIPMIQQQVVGKFISEDLLLNMLAVSESTPGPFAINLATFIGMHVGNDYGLVQSLLGATFCVAGVILPSLIIIILVSILFDKFKKSRVVSSLLFGIRPVVVGLIFSAFIGVFLSVVLGGFSLKISDLQTSQAFSFDWKSLILILIMFILSQIKIKGKKISILLLLFFSAVCGILLFAF